jgi:Fe-Mn family superoxide dismutase
LAKGNKNIKQHNKQTYFAMSTNNKTVATMPHLAYRLDALSPHLSLETMDYHYNKHLKGYVDQTNNLVQNTRFENCSLVEIVKNAEGPLFNNAAQVWNHTFFFEGLSPTPKKAPTDRLKALIDYYFGSFHQFVVDFNKTAMALFGSGWVWLAQDSHDRLMLLSTHNAATPLSDELNPLLVVDVWEHAYYIDYRNRRADYLNSVWEVIDWHTVESRLR